MCIRAASQTTTATLMVAIEIRDRKGYNEIKGREGYNEIKGKDWD